MALCPLRPSKASGKGRLGEPHHDGDVRKRIDRGANEAPRVRGNRRVRPAGIRARGRAGVPVRAGGERRGGETTETSRGGIHRDVADLGEGGQGARPGDRQRPQGEGPDRDEVRRAGVPRRAISPPSLFLSTVRMQPEGRQSPRRKFVTPPIRPSTVPTMKPPPPAKPTMEKTIARGLPRDFFRWRMSHPATIARTPEITDTTPTMSRYGRTMSGGGAGTMFRTSRIPCTAINAPPMMTR